MRITDIPQIAKVPRDSNGHRRVLLEDLWRYLRPACRYGQPDGSMFVYYAGDPDMPVVEE